MSLPKDLPDGTLPRGIPMALAYFLQTSLPWAGVEVGAEGTRSSCSGRFEKFSAWAVDRGFQDVELHKGSCTRGACNDRGPIRPAAEHQGFML